MRKIVNKECRRKGQENGGQFFMMIKLSDSGMNCDEDNDCDVLGDREMRIM